MTSKRRRHKSQGEREAELLANPRWKRLCEQDRLIAANHTAESNDAAARRCRQLIEGGIDTVSWSELLGEQ